MGVWAHEQARVLQRNGNQVTVISLTPWLPKIKYSPAKIYHIASIPSFENYDDVGVHHLKIPVWPQVSFVNQLYMKFPALKAYIAYMFAKRKIMKIIERNQIEVIHAHGPSYDGLVSYLVGKDTGLPFCVTENSAWEPVYALKYNHKMEQIYQFIFKEAAHIVPVSQLIKNRINDFNSVSQEKLTIVHPGVDLIKTGTIRGEKPAQYQHHEVILSVGALEERKGHIFLIEAIHQIIDDYPNLKCLIVGADSTEENKLHERIRQLQLTDVVEIVGQLPHEGALEYISWCDIFVLPSWLEAFGVVFAEAMAYGKPIIGIEGEGISDVIDHGENGLLVPPKDATSLAMNIRELLDNAEYRNQLGQAGKLTVEKYLTWDFNASQMEDIYKKTIDERLIL